MADNWTAGKLEIFSRYYIILVHLSALVKVHAAREAAASESDTKFTAGLR